MALLVHQLQVQEDQARVGQGPLEGIPRDVRRGVQGGVETLGATASENLGREVGLHQRLPARERHPPARGLVENPVAQNLLDHLLDRHVAPLDLEGPGETRLGTLPTEPTLRRVVPPLALYEAQRPGRTGLEARPTPDALLRNEHQLLLGRKRLRIVAPPTPQRAAFQEHRGADARPVVEGY